VGTTLCVESKVTCLKVMRGSTPTRCVGIDPDNFPLIFCPVRSGFTDSVTLSILSSESIGILIIGLSPIVTTVGVGMVGLLLMAFSRDLEEVVFVDARGNRSVLRRGCGGGGAGIVQDCKSFGMGSVTDKSIVENRAAGTVVWSLYVMTKGVEVMT
jgi:hypothetical protein